MAGNSQVRAAGSSRDDPPVAGGHLGPLLRALGTVDSCELRVLSPQSTTTSLPVCLRKEAIFWETGKLRCARQ